MRVRFSSWRHPASSRRRRRDPSRAHGPSGRPFRCHGATGAAAGSVAASGGASRDGARGGPANADRAIERVPLAGWRGCFSSSAESNRYCLPATYQTCTPDTASRAAGNQALFASCLACRTTFHRSPPKASAPQAPFLYMVSCLGPTTGRRAPAPPPAAGVDRTSGGQDRVRAAIRARESDLRRARTPCYSGWLGSCRPLLHYSRPRNNTTRPSASPCTATAPRLAQGRHTAPPGPAPVGPDCSSPAAPPALGSDRLGPWANRAPALGQPVRPQAGTLAQRTIPNPKP